MSKVLHEYCMHNAVQYNVAVKHVYKLRTYLNSSSLFIHYYLLLTELNLWVRNIDTRTANSIVLACTYTAK
jgi:hypothetical protein